MRELEAASADLLGRDKPHDVLSGHVREHTKPSWSITAIRSLDFATTEPPLAATQGRGRRSVAGVRRPRSPSTRLAGW